eukprot:TRINITY_DN109255_c0_g1_i1.p1 TRINITY_DN109255_c0_g1~~TRINITY_DN109255_c0_g1_i1.p1  ORF type:complete len:386 (+),score=57.09 TRINITY_DN109255_c0_g1_i1:101-1258(+)
MSSEEGEAAGRAMNGNAKSTTGASSAGGSAAKTSPSAASGSSSVAGPIAGPMERGGAKARAWFNAYGQRRRGSGGGLMASGGSTGSMAPAPSLEEGDPLRGFELSFLSLSGVDDSVSPRTLCDISQEFSFVEWGVNFRAEKQGREPRYASLAWLRLLQEEIDRRQQSGKFAPIHFAAHLGGEYCVDVLKGDTSLVRTLWEDYGFLRVHLCPTRAHGVNSSQLKKYLPTLKSVIIALPQVEFVLLVTKETRALTFQLMNDCQPNLAFLYNAEEEGDSSGQTGGSSASAASSTAKAPKYRRPPPCPHPGIHCGYGGGLTSDNLASELRSIAQAVGTPRRPVWVDLESGLRSRGPGRPDEFDLGKAWACIRTVFDLDLPRPRPTFASR